MTRFLKVALVSALFSVGLNAADFLSSVTNGAISDSSNGVKQLDASEMREVIGGYDFYRLSELDFVAGPFRSYAFFVSDDAGGIPKNLYKAYGGTLDPNTLLVGHFGIGNGQRQHYLQIYFPDRSYIAYIGPEYNRIMSDFKSKVY